MNISKNLHSMFLTICLAVMMSACTADKPAEKRAFDSRGEERQGMTAPAASQGAALYRLHIVAQTPGRGSTLLLVAEGFPIDSARIEWRVNSVTVPSAKTARFVVDNVRRGDKVQAIAFLEGREILSDTVTIVNSAPEFTKIKIMPEIFRPGDMFFADVAAEDPDDDDVAIRYEWLVNGQSAGQTKTCGVAVKRGDIITLTLTASDGKRSSAPVVLKRELRNMPPMILEETALACNVNICSGQVRASDPDGDKLIFSLKKGPQGMSIDPDAGFIQWKIPAPFVGRESIIISVSDGHGGEATKTFPVDIVK